MAVLGIDPGKEGALALRAVGWVDTLSMPVTEEKEIDCRAIWLWLYEVHQEIEHAFIERQGVRPGQHPHSGYVTGVGYGKLLGILESMGIPYTIVSPQTWSKEFPHGVSAVPKGADDNARAARYREVKTARKRIATELFPELDLRKTERSIGPDEGMTEALLIAEFGHRQKAKGKL